MVACLTRLALFHVFRATVAAIVLAVLVVVARVAIVIPNVQSLACQALVFVFRIQAFTHLAVKEVMIFGGATAIATIPTATTMVVFIIACFIPFPAVFMARSAACLALVFGIQALTILTVQICGLPATAVTTVPATATVVVTVIAVAISLPASNLATPITVIGHSRV